MSTDTKKHEYCQETVDLKQEGERIFLQIGERLYNIRKEELFRPFWDSFYEYELEFKWSPGTANKLINIYKVFVLEAGIKPVQLGEAGGWTVLAECLPVIKNKKDAQHWLGQATELTRSDLRKSIAEAKAGPQEECAHPPAEIYYLKVYGCCGVKEQFNPNNGEVRAPKKTGVDIRKSNQKIV